MKEQKKDFELRQDEKKKIPYEKPQLNEVKLFADQVLGGCFAVIGCNDNVSS